MTAGFYTGGTFGWPTPVGGVGIGVYSDDRGNFYPQIYYGTPGGSTSTGYTPDLEGLLTGTSISASFGDGTIRYNIGTSAGSFGAGVGTPGIGETYGFGPYKLDPAPLDAAGEVNGNIYNTGFDLPGADSSASMAPSGSGTPNVWSVDAAGEVNGEDRKSVV